MVGSKHVKNLNANVTSSTTSQETWGALGLCSHFSSNRHHITFYPKGSRIRTDSQRETKESKNHNKEKQTTKWDNNPTGARKLATISTPSSPKVFN